MPIYKMQPALVINTTVDLPAQIKDDSVAPSPAVAVPHYPTTQNALRLPLDQVSLLLDAMVKPASIRVPSAPDVGQSIFLPNDRDRSTPTTDQGLSDAVACPYALARNPNALASSSHHDSSAQAAKTSRSFPSPTTPAPKSRALSDVSLLASRPTFSPAWTTSLPPTFEANSPPGSPASSTSTYNRDRSPESDSARSSRSTTSGSSFPPPDPHRDITRIRVTSGGNAFLYPGASFSGTQKSGRNNYDVTVTVVNVDFASNFLCGYLKISNLTEDYPELTTYFDAEIIGGASHGFLTQGSSYCSTSSSVTEVEDMTHWGRFPAFRSIKHELKRPDLTVSEEVIRKRGVVFMRWKERFLVPDWKVQDISGASFAGFYYVCVEFGSAPPPPSQTPSAARRRLSSGVNPPMRPTKSASCPPAFSIEEPASAQRSTRPICRSSGWANMTGFYYHAESEPYQQLSLTYDAPVKPQSTFEFA